LPKTLIAAEYMTRFRCIGPDCEDTCCQGWRVNLTKEDFEKIRAIGDTQGDPRIDAALREKPEHEQVFYNWGYLQHGEGCACPMMDAGWCLLHRDHGERSLPVVCATFPRMILERDDRVELHGRLSCPEIARLSLLAEQPPALVAEQPDLPEIFETQVRADDNHGHYQRGLDTVTRFCDELLRLETYPLEARLYFVIYLGKRADAYLRQGVANDPDARLTRLIERMRDPAFQQKLAGEWGAVPEPDDRVLSLLFGVLGAHLDGPHNQRYNAFRQRMLTRLTEGRDPTVMSMDTLRARFLTHKLNVVAHCADRLRGYDRNFAHTWFGQAFYLGDPTLMVPIKKFLLYRAMTRLLFFLHPEVTQDPDAAFVACVQTFMKTMDANLYLLRPTLEQLEKLGLDRVGSLASFLRV